MLRLADEIKAVAVRQIQVADQHIKLHPVETGARILQGLGRNRAAAATIQEQAEHAARVAVIFDEENKHASTELNRK